ncbi:MAG: hypothetical protein ABSC37_13095 [Xanthobacteraceae bacterium]
MRGVVNSAANCAVSPDVNQDGGGFGLGASPYRIGDTALRLGHWFGTSAQFWLNLQSAYDIRVAEKAAGARIRRLPKRA